MSRQIELANRAGPSSLVITDADRRFMARALTLARRGRRTAAPNPAVGCVIALDNRIVGEGWHVAPGSAHAEIIALAAAGDRAAKAGAYVSLEPCSRQGRTGPCHQALIDAGIARVVIATRDPSMGGRGIELLEQAGIRVSCGCSEAEARELNRGFFKRLEHQLPWVAVKLAASLDGRTAWPQSPEKAPRWITGPRARRDVHELRALSCCVLSGIGTVLADDPRLDVRLPASGAGERPPLKAVLDSRLRTPPSARLLRTAGATLIFSGTDADKDCEKREQRLGEMGAEVVRVPRASGGLDLKAVLAELGRRQCNEVMVEAGATLAGALVAANLVDEINLYTAPLILGSTAPPLLHLKAPATGAFASAFKLLRTRTLGPDLRLDWRRCDSRAQS